MANPARPAPALYALERFSNQFTYPKLHKWDAEAVLAYIATLEGENARLCERLPKGSAFDVIGDYMDLQDKVEALQARVDYLCNRIAELEGAAHTKTAS